MNVVIDTSGIVVLEKRCSKKQRCSSKNDMVYDDSDLKKKREKKNACQSYKTHGGEDETILISFDEYIRSCTSRNGGSTKEKADGGI